ncbi:Imm8 family immunity protein [Micromonospora sp. NPDC049559]|uniref:Imm8 family immunity protein n=1 Tax=Micromonospora sp. NPDC049559 TaxID=3155923 RepID=UPI003445BF9E
MRVAVHGITFPDFDRNAAFDPDDTVQLVEIVAGPSEGPGQELFQATVCTPTALSRMVADQEVVVGRHWLFVESFTPNLVEGFLRKLINNIEGRDWDEVAAKLGRLAQYEFEDYTP